MREALRVEGFELSYPTWTLRVPRFVISAGERVVLMGPSGIGKSSFFRWLCGLPLEGQTCGALWLVGRRCDEAPPERRGFGVLFQDPLLLPHLTALENVESVLRFRGVGRTERRERATAILRELGLGERLGAFPESLSGGEKTRAALARALVFRPSVLLLDEPFASLDVALRGELRAWLKKWIETTGAALLLVSHDEEDARSFATQVFDFQVSRSNEPFELRELLARN